MLSAVTQKTYRDYAWIAPGRLGYHIPTGVSAGIVDQYDFE